ncbi:MAG: DDE-type integrase/transposase/recombinase [Deltaproteobacteria bacterium]|nr:DDE-type integrase/transposase/recombinase [Deltaproteobacteria bacterium]
MLDYDTRSAILRLRREGHGHLTIARALKVSRNAVRRVLKSGEAKVPALQRATQVDPHIETVRALHTSCEGNMIRVQEELERAGHPIPYSTLTRFCRAHGIGVAPKVPAGSYTFGPGQESQHDTSPHRVLIGGTRQLVQCASLVLCFSRMTFAKVYARFTRLECRAFLTEAACYFEGTTDDCMTDNTSVVVGSGTGKNAVPAPAMLAFAERFGFHFIAHELGDANRSARVERPFDYIERNFYPGRTFADIDDLNRQLREWCGQVNRRPKRSLQCAPLELFEIEKPRLHKLPLHVPEVYDQHIRRVDTEGYVSLHANRYSVPAESLGRQVQIRESVDNVRIFDGHQLLAEHKRRPTGARQRALLPEHRARRIPQPGEAPTHEERALRAVSSGVSQLIDILRKRHGGRAVRSMKQLHKMWRDYPADSLVIAVDEALAYGLSDLNRIESMILRHIDGDFFRLPATDVEPAIPVTPTTSAVPTTEPERPHDEEEDPPTE